MKRIKLMFTGLIAAGVIFAGCASSRARSYIAAGDNVSAVEVLAQTLNRKSSDNEAAVLFAELYPAVVEERLSVIPVSQVRQNYLGKYGKNDIDAIRNMIKENGKDRLVSSHPVIGALLRDGEKSVTICHDLVRIQNAVAPLPSFVGNAKKGGVFEVRKYSNNFSGQWETSKLEMGQLYFDIAEAAFPGETIAQKKEILDFYQKALRYNPYVGNVSAKTNRLCYEIAMFIKKNASTKNEYFEVLTYLQQAGDYADTALQIIDVKYELALLYKAEGNRRSYEQAGELFIDVGNYKNAPQEAYLYNFYKKLSSLRKDYNYNNVYLSAGSRTAFNVKATVNQIDSKRSRIDASLRTSEIMAYTIAGAQKVFPGAIIEGESIPEQTFNLFAKGARNPVSFTLSSNGNVLANGEITNTTSASASLTQIQQLAKANLRGIQPVTTYEFSEIFTPEQLKLYTGLGLDRNRVLFANENSNWNSSKNYVLVKVKQVYYTANMKAPALPVDFFAPGKGVVHPEDLKNVTPYYVSAVNYGRSAYFFVSSNLSAAEIIKDIETYRPRDYRNSGITGMKVSPEVSRKWSSNGTVVSSITVSEKLYSIADIDGMYQWIKTGVDMGLDIPDLAPVSFEMRNLYDNSYAVLSKSGSFEVLNSVLNRGKEENVSGVQQTGSSAGGTGGSSQAGSSQSNSGSTAGSSQSGSSQSNSGTTAGGSQSGSSSQNVSGGVSSASGNSYTSLSLTGNSGVYNCAVITSGDEWIYYVDEKDIVNCRFDWNTSDIQKIYVNGIEIAKGSTVYSFRDVLGNNISLDIVDAGGNRVHHLLKVLKK